MREGQIASQLQRLIESVEGDQPGYGDCNARLLERLRSAQREYEQRYADDQSSDACADE